MEFTENCTLQGQDKREFRKAASPHTRGKRTWGGCNAQKGFSIRTEGAGMGGSIPERLGTARLSCGKKVRRTREDLSNSREKSSHGKGSGRKTVKKKGIIVHHQGRCARGGGGEGGGGEFLNQKKGGTTDN